MEAGKVPTTPTTASVVAGIQCQEAVKFLHGLDVLSGQGFRFEGMTHESHLITFTRKADCMSHEPDAPVVELSERVGETRVGDFLERVRRDVGPDAVIETGQDLLASLECLQCNEVEPMLLSLGKVTERQGRCPRCGHPRRPNTFHTIDGSEGFLDCTLAEIGVPPWDVLAGRRGLEQRFYEFQGDRIAVLGALAL
jgi:adenylyltransferase/sulfurtransferase